MLGHMLATEEFGQAQGHNYMPVKFEPPTSQSGAQHTKH